MPVDRLTGGAAMVGRRHDRRPGVGGAAGRAVDGFLDRILGGWGSPMNAWKKPWRTLGIPVIAVLINAAVIGIVLVKMPPLVGDGPATWPNSPLALRPKATVGEGTGKLSRQGEGTPQGEPARTSRKARGESAREGLAKEGARPGRDQTD